ncbi:MAG: HAD-IIIA family hydrolase [Chloroflexi bacterium]|nr:MAG: HAD-IIIA family hydrolase [Chloroflexota bacterium]
MTQPPTGDPPVREPVATDPAFDPARIKVVAFDGYGTIFDFANRDFHVAVTSILAEQRIETDIDAFFQTWVSSSNKASVWSAARVNDQRADPDVMMNGPLPGWHSTWETWRRQFDIAFEHYNLQGDGAVAADYLRHALSHVEPYPDAHDTIDMLARRGYLVALLSNADEDFLQSALSRARLRFSIIQSSESLRAYKPHRAIFAALCARASYEPHEILYVGDSANADVSGAQNAGLATAWVRRDDRPYPERMGPPSVVVDQLAELLPVLTGVTS